MDVSKMYIPDPQKWMKYYEQVAKGHHNAYINNKNRTTFQRGGSIARKTVGFMDSIGLQSLRPKSSEPIEIVSPVHQVVDQAESNIRRDKKRYKRKNSIGDHNRSYKHRKGHTVKKLSTKSKSKEKDIFSR